MKRQRLYDGEIEGRQRGDHGREENRGLSHPFRIASQNTGPGLRQLVLKPPVKKKTGPPAGACDILFSRHRHVEDVFNRLRLVAPTKATVLLTGETGTGKTLLARSVHFLSNRWKQPFINVHCGAFADSLIESELFGHEKGAFTGAIRTKPGKFESAQGGTIFLDEVGTMTAQAQIKLLEVLQDGVFQHVGGAQMIRADVRVIAATNSDLKTLTETGFFRKDLYYRLNVFPVQIPPVRSRPKDIPGLVRKIMEQLNRKMGKKIHLVDPRVMAALARYMWPGNIRELENVLERAYILEQSAVLSPGSFSSDFFPGDIPKGMIIPNVNLTLAEARKEAVTEFERGYLKKLLAVNQGKINCSAKMAGVTARQLHKLMRKHHLRKEDYLPAG